MREQTQLEWLLSKCNPRGMGVYPCPHDGLGCVYPKTCLRDMNATTMDEFGCEKRRRAQKRAESPNGQCGEKR